MLNLRIIATLHKVVSYTLITLIMGIRPLLGPAHCKFKVSCTPYAIAQLKEKNIIIAVCAIIKRLALCSPFSSYQEC